jgi:hypothetical protein
VLEDRRRNACAEEKYALQWVKKGELTGGEEP